MERNAALFAKGARALADWLGSGRRPVMPSLAQHRAECCKICPLNRKSDDWKDVLTEKASAFTTLYFKLKDNLSLKVDGEDQLGICSGCWCSLKLKVHVPIVHISEHTSNEELLGLWNKCWILEEIEGWQTNY